MRIGSIALVDLKRDRFEVPGRRAHQGELAYRRAQLGGKKRPAMAATSQLRALPKGAPPRAGAASIAAAIGASPDGWQANGGRGAGDSNEPWSPEGYS